MSDKVNCPACKKPTTISYGDWSPIGYDDFYICPNCGAKLNVDVEAFGGSETECSWPVTTLTVIEGSDIPND